jgi:hypothetical protein
MPYVIVLTTRSTATGFDHIISDFPFSYLLWMQNNWDLRKCHSKRGNRWKEQGGTRLSTVCLSMYSITENIYYSRLSSVAILLQPETNCFTSYNTSKWLLCSLSLCACGLPLSLWCLLLTVSEAHSYVASTIPFTAIDTCIIPQWLAQLLHSEYLTQTSAGVRSNFCYD